MHRDGPIIAYLAREVAQMEEEEKKLAPVVKKEASGFIGLDDEDGPQKSFEFIMRKGFGGDSSDDRGGGGGSS